MAFASFGARVADDNPLFFEVHIIAAVIIVGVFTLFGVLDPLICVSVILLAVVTRSMSQNVQRNRSNQIEKYTYDSAKQVLEPPIVSLPDQDNLLHMAWLDSSTNPPQVRDIKAKTDADVKFKQVDGAPGAYWTGPPSSELLANPSLSVFVTLDASQELTPATLLLILGISSNASDVDAGDAQRQLSMSVREVGGDYELYATYGKDDSAGSKNPSLLLPPMSSKSPRTFYIIKTANALKVGFFDTLTSEGVMSDPVALTGTFQSISTDSSMNARKESIGGIQSVMVYSKDMTDSLPAVKKSMTRYVLSAVGEHNEILKPVQDVADKYKLLQETPWVSGVGSACNVKDWTQYDPSKVSQTCRDAIGQSCERDPSQNHCECFDTKNADVYASTECKLWRQMHGVSEPVLVSNTQTGAEAPAQVAAVQMSTAPVTAKSQGTQETPDPTYIPPLSNFTYFIPL